MGPHLGVEASRLRYGVSRALPLSALPDMLRNLRRLRVFSLGGLDPTVDATLGRSDNPLQRALAEMRLIKDDAEIAALRQAMASTRRGFEAMVRSLKTAHRERDLEAVFSRVARMEGNDVGYLPVIAAGPHACILHWTDGHGELRPGELLLMDAGVEDTSLYSADITRTLPLSGVFTPAQRDIYDLVLAAQTAAIQAVRPGNAYGLPHQVAMGVLAQGLAKLGFVAASKAQETDAQLYRRYTLHATSHMLGLDVHDCGTARDAVLRDGPLREGMVLTVEPGLYFQPNDLTVPARYRGLGVRIEDDVWVTSAGYEILSDLPREARSVEVWMKSLAQ